MRLVTLAVASFLLLFVGSISSQNNPEANRKQQQADERQSAPQQTTTTVQVNVGTPVETTATQPAKQGAKTEPKSFMTNGEWVISCITTVYVLVAFLTFKAMRNSSERQLRAYVVAELGSIVNIADPIPTPGLIPTEARRVFPWGPIARIHIKNTGQTPAFKVEHWGNICFKEFPLTSELPPRIDTGVRSLSIVGPGIINTKNFFFGPILTDEQVAQLRNSTGALYVYGEVRYEDAFKRQHRTRYRLFHNQAGGAVGVSTDLTFTAEGNEAD
jgi:hypothetical protein